MHREGRQKSGRPPPSREPHRDPPATSIWPHRTMPDLPTRTATTERHHLHRSGCGAPPPLSASPICAAVTLG
jgi:hypothetical protein